MTAPIDTRSNSQHTIVKAAILSTLNGVLSTYDIHVPPTIQIVCGVNGCALLADNRDVNFQRMLKARPDIAESLLDILDLARRQRESALQNAMQGLTSGRQSSAIRKFLRDFEIAEAPGPLSIWFDGNDVRVQEYSNEGWGAVKTEATFIAAW
jgi:hypothetical protein